jgi:hypothetical protein
MAVATEAVDMDLAMEIVDMASSALPAMEDMDSPASTE